MIHPIPTDGLHLPHPLLQIYTSLFKKSPLYVLYVCIYLNIGTSCNFGIVNIKHP